MNTKTLILAALLFVPSLGTCDDLWKKHTILEASPKNGSINSAVAFDFNGDGNLDVIASYAGAVHLHLAPDWRSHVIHTFSAQDSQRKVGRACIHSCLMDVDGDGDQDFVGSNQTVFWLECPADPLGGPWTFRTVDDEILGSHCVITGDVDQDGKIDLIANSFQKANKTSVPESIVWLSVPNDYESADAWDRHVFAMGDAPGGSHYMGLGDVDGDGRPDISCGAKGGPGFEGGQWFAWWKQPKDSAERWTKHMLSANEPGASNIHPLDYDRDGHTDFLATRGHGVGIVLFRGPEFKPTQVDTEIEGPHCLVTTDLDGDGDVDAATCGHQKDGIAAWYENDGKANFTRHVIGRDQSAYDIRAVDLDGDADLDLLVAGHFSKNIVWFENPMRASQSR